MKKIKSKKKWTKKNIILAILLSLGIIAIGLAIFFIIYIILSAPEFDKSLLYDKEMTVLKDKNGEVFARLGAENRTLVTYDDLPEVLIDAIVATEDSRFFQHNGLDIARFAKATLGQLMGHSGAGGASTLTMQISKLTYTSTESGGIEGIIRKFTDIYFSVFKIEKVYTKEEIIEFYVNSPWLGNGCWGVEAASQKYFGKSVKDLTLAEASLMAGIFNLPADYNPFASIELATKRRSVVLELMVRHGYITDEQRDYAESISVESLIVPKEERATGMHEYQTFIDAVTLEVQKKTNLNPYNTPMIIETTLDRDVQNALNTLNIQDDKKYYQFVDDIVNTAVAVTDVHNGSVAGIYGGRNQDRIGAYNYAIQMHHHPGSTAKPIFDYAPYLEYNNGSTYTPFIDDTMTYSNGQAIKNSDGSYLGVISMRTALSRSRNIPALQAFQQTDEEKISEFVHSLGINYGDTLYESMSIGGFDGVSPLELSAAYAAFASGGYYTEPYLVTKITYFDNDDEYVHKTKRVRVMSEETAYMINSMLITCAGLGTPGKITVKNTDIAAKSGTSTWGYEAIKAAEIPSKVAGSLSRDNWVDVYSADYSIAVWYGYEYLNKDHYTTANTGDNERKKITAQVANQILGLKAGSKFNVPSGVTTVRVEKETFPPKLAVEGYTPENMIVEEIFRKGTEPTEYSDRYTPLENPSNGNYISDGTTITISWDGISTPKAIDTNSLQNEFNTYYSRWAEKYYEKRLTYNINNIGNLGYQVYLKVGGDLRDLGFTPNTSFTYACPAQSCTFVVKSSYSIFKKNQSSPGLTIETTNEYIDEPTQDNITLSYIGGNTKCLSTDVGTYEESKPLELYNNGKIVTNEASIETNYYLNQELVNEISLSNPGVYLAKYKIHYHDQIYNGSKTINVCSNGCNVNNECN